MGALRALKACAPQNEEKTIVTTTTLSPARGSSPHSLPSPNTVAKAISEDLRCSICFEFYVLPTTLPCGHTFCRYCVWRGPREARDKLGCPVCRLPIGTLSNTNVAMMSLIKTLSIRPRDKPRSKTDLSLEKDCNEVNPNSDDDDDGFICEPWWLMHITKKACPLSAFCLMLIVNLSGRADEVFTNDAVACAYQFFETNNLWDPAEHMTTMESARALCLAIGLRHSYSSQWNADCLQRWVEQCVEANLHIVAGDSAVEGKDGMAFRILNDRSHGIQGAMIRSSDIAARLPWVGGRHHSAHIRVKHSSLSLFHFMVLNVSGRGSEVGEGGLRLMDCNSSVGTAVRLPKDVQLEDGWIIHLADRVELTVHIMSIEETLRFYSKDTNKWKAEGTVNLVPPDVRRAWDSFAGGIVSTKGGSPPPPSESTIPLLILSLCSSSDIPAIDSAEQQAPDADRPRRWVIDPLGVTLGRGPLVNRTWSNWSKKISVTTSNGNVSREHCLVHYALGLDGKPSWRLKDLSSFGTFRTLVPFSDMVPIKIGDTFKAGQCKIEVVTNKQSAGRSPPATLQSEVSTNEANRTSALAVATTTATATAGEYLLSSTGGLTPHQALLLSDWPGHGSRPSNVLVRNVPLQRGRLVRIPGQEGPFSELTAFNEFYQAGAMDSLVSIGFENNPYVPMRLTQRGNRRAGGELEREIPILMGEGRNVDRDCLIPAITGVEATDNFAQHHHHQESWVYSGSPSALPPALRSLVTWSRRS